MRPTLTYDYALVGGGLQNALICQAVLRQQPSARICLIEQHQKLGGNHTWSFHAGDLEPGALEWMGTLVTHYWPSYEVRFPALRRTLHQGYYSISSARLDSILQERLAHASRCSVRLGARAVAVGAHEVLLEDGETVVATAVVDARGPAQPVSSSACCFQKFVGLELRLPRPGVVERPLVMDATLQQEEGLRFVYVLPLSPAVILVEDTYYAEQPGLDRERLRQRVIDYVVQRGWAAAHELVIEREESGVLPVPLTPLPAQAPSGPLVAGYQGGWFHPTTGYSLPLALRLAHHIATSPPQTLFGQRWRTLRSAHQAQTSFCCALNRALFGALEGPHRYRLLERFYGLPEETISRFYSLRLTPADAARILLGRPPRGLSWRGLLRATLWGS